MKEILLSASGNKAYIKDFVSRGAYREYEKKLYSNVKVELDQAEEDQEKLKTAAKAKMSAMNLTNSFEADEALVLNMLVKLELDGKTYENISTELFDEILKQEDYEIIKDACKAIVDKNKEDKKKLSESQPTA